MRILVTGGAGFIGGHLVEELLSQKFEVIVVDDESATSSDTFNWFPQAKNHKFSILEKEKLESLFKNGFDYVFHLAAETKIQLSIDDPTRCFNTNIMGTLNILELSKKYNVKRVIVASSSSVYGMNPASHYEGQREDCLNPYAASKLCDEIICNTYFKIFGLETICFRFFNVYGDRMPNRGSYAPVIAIFMRQKSNNEELTITGDGLQKRDFVSVKDVVSGLICGMNTTNKKTIGKTYNIGSGKNISVLDIARMFNWKYMFIPERIGDAKETLADLTNIKNDLNWEPKINLLQWLKERL